VRRSFIMVFPLVLASLVLPAFVLPAFAGVNGNGSPSGRHFNINIIGVPNQKNTNFDGGEGSRIFVLRTGMTSFYVQGGTSFAILDHDGTDGYVGWSRTSPGLIFPYDATATPTWRVAIYVRLLGPTDSSIRWTSYYFDGSGWALIAQFTLKRDTPSKFSLKTGDLLMDGYQDILWELDQKTDFRLVQMRIYLLG